MSSEPPAESGSAPQVIELIIEVVSHGGGTKCQQRNCKICWANLHMNDQRINVESFKKKNPLENP